MKAVKIFMVTMALAVTLTASAGKPTVRQMRKIQQTAKLNPLTAIRQLNEHKQRAIEAAQWQQVLMADMSLCDTWARISEDSLALQLERMKQTELLVSRYEPVVASLYEIYLALYADDPHPYYDYALSRSPLLAKAKAKDYRQLINFSPFSNYYGDDMLSVVLHTVDDRDLLRQHYEECGNRAGLMMMALKDLPPDSPLQAGLQLASLDSLSRLYDDLDEAIEIDIEKARVMQYALRPEGNGAADYYDFLQKAIGKRKRNPRVGILKRMQRDVSAPHVSLRLPRLSTTSDSLILTADIRHVEKVGINIYRSPLDNTQYNDWGSHVSRKEALKIIRPSLFRKRKVRSVTAHFNTKHPATTTDTTLTLTPLPPGCYVMKIKVKGIPKSQYGTFRYGVFYVSDIRTIGIALPDSLLRLAALDATTGQPKADAHVTWLGSEDTLRIDLDEQGETTIKMTDGRINETDMFYVQAGDDRYQPEFGEATYAFVYYDDEEDTDTPINIFTDRSIYRPGQTVHVAAISKQKKLTLKLTRERKEIVSEEVATDDYGTAHADFVLPKDLVTGNYQVIAEGEQLSSQRTDIRIEEYKLPTFEVTLEQPDGHFVAGDSVTVKGCVRSMTGQPIARATVKFSINRKNAEETLTTDSDGRFGIPLRLAEEISRPDIQHVEASVTDEAGETQTAHCTVKARQKAFDFRFSAEQVMRTDDRQPLTLEAVDNAGRKVALPFTYWLKGREGSIWQATTNEAFCLPATEPDRYTIVAVCEGDTIDTSVILFDITATRPCTTIDDWSYQSATTFSKDQPVILQVGSSLRDVHLLYNILSGNRMLEQGTIDFSDSIITRRFDYCDDYRDGLTVTYAWVKNGACHRSTLFVAPPAADDQLQLQWHTFRDRLVPGQQETWRLRILNSDGSPADSQLMATIYDQSLDRLNKHCWNVHTPAAYHRSYHHWTLLQDEYLMGTSRFNYTATKGFSFLTTPYPSTLRLSRIRDFSSGTVTGVANGMVRGHVTDANGEDLIGVSITIVGDKDGLGTVTDINGRYTISAKPGSTLAFNYIGFMPYYRKVTGSQINVRMAEDNTLLEEVVVTGYGTQKRMLYTGATRNTSKSNVRQQLEGSVSGIRVRGMSNANTNGQEAKPLIIIDGIIIDDTSLDEIDLKEVDTFSMLDTDEATALYGSRGSNGVVVITTKRNAQRQQELMQMPIRENFMETAYFAPTLTTDSLGNIDLQFTLPESITTWRLLGLAHTRDMRFGTTEGTAIARKDFMVQPQLPRFLREGDEADLRARIYNTSDRDIDGEATLQLLDPETERIVATSRRAFHAEKDSVAVVAFNGIYTSAPAVKGATASPTLLCKVVATADGMSDGEQHLLPVISRQELVTKTKAFTLAAGTRQHIVDLDSLLAPTGTSHLTAEFTGRPSMLALQTLHEYADPQDDCALCQASAYFSLRLTQELMRRHPDLTDSLKTPLPAPSPLARNQEVKALLLSETPWIRQADKEDEQRRALAEYLNTASLQEKVAKASEALEKLQDDQGGWSWFEGMDASPFITMEVTTLLLRAQALCPEEDPKTEAQTSRAFDYLKQNGMETTPAYQYLCALSGRPTDRKTTRQMARLAKDTDWQSLYELARTAVVISNDRPDEARDIVRGLKEYSVYDEAKGRYYDARRAANSWFDYKIPTQVAVIEALQTVTPEDRQTIGEMQQWLLQEKRTQYWQTTINSMNAIYAIISSSDTRPTATDAMTTGTDGADRPVLTLDGIKLPIAEQLPSIGYVKVSTEVDGTAHELAVDRTDNGYAWGAVYTQYLQPTDEVEAYASDDLSVTRDIIPLEAGPLTVGKKVRVRVTVQAGRDLDFVQIVDKRAACLEPVEKASGYRDGAYIAHRDTKTTYFKYKMSKGTHVFESDYYLDRSGRYQTGTLTVQCAYAPEFMATAPAATLSVRD